MAIQTQTFKKRVRAHSTLSPQALTVALVVADLRYEARLHSHEPLALSLADLARECHMSRRTVVRWLDECVTAGWIAGCQVFRDGRQQPNRYWIADPTDEAECTRLHSVIASQGQILSAGVAHIVRRRLHTVVRSNNASGGDAAPPGPAESRDEEDTLQPPPPNVHSERTPASLPVRPTDAAAADAWLEELSWRIHGTSDYLNPTPRAFGQVHHLVAAGVTCKQALDMLGNNVNRLRPDGILDALEQLSAPAPSYPTNDAQAAAALDEAEALYTLEAAGLLPPATPAPTRRPATAESRAAVLADIRRTIGTRTTRRPA